MSWNRVWEDIFRTNAWGKYPGEDLIRFVARDYYKTDRKATKILEIGSGPGANVWFLAREGFATYGIDGSPTAIRQCEERLTGEGLKADLRVGDIGSLPYDDGMFSAVIDIECLCCNSHAATRTIIAEAARVLKPGGKFYSRTFAEGMYVGATRRELGPLEYDEVSDGTFHGKGFVRLTSEASIDDLYGAHFDVQSREIAQYTSENRTQTTIEWQLTCVKA